MSFGRSTSNAGGNDNISEVKEVEVGELNPSYQKYLLSVGQKHCSYELSSSAVHNPTELSCNGVSHKHHGEVVVEVPAGDILTLLQEIGQQCCTSWSRRW